MQRNLKLLICAAVLQASVASAQGPALAGQAVDSLSGTPLADIVVFAFLDKASQSVAKTVTDDRGLFVLPLPSDGAYQLTFSRQCRRVLYAPVDTVAGDTTVQRKYVLTFTPFPPDSVFGAIGLDAPATLKLRGEIPHFPSRALRARRGGRIELEFVVDTTGKVEMNSVRVSKTPDLEFTTAVIQSLPRAQYEPARLCGQHVRQWVHEIDEFQLPFG